MPIDDHVKEFDPADLDGNSLPNKVGEDTATVVNAPTLVAGEFFSYFQIDTTKAVRLTLPNWGAFTYVAWMRYPADTRAGKYHHILSFDSDQLTYLIKATGEAFGGARVGDIYHYQTGFSSSEIRDINGPLNQWFMFVARYDGTDLTFSVNVASRGAPITAGALPGGLYSIGLPSTMSQELEKMEFDLGPVRFYDRALTIAEEADLYAEYLTPPEAPTAGQVPSTVSGTVQINGTPAERLVRAFSYNEVTQIVDGQELFASKSLGHAMSDAATGAYEIKLFNNFNKDVFVVAFDDYGDPFTPDAIVNVGDKIHPTTPNGYVYECVGGGTLPSGEPTWSGDTDNPQNYGTASLLAIPFYRALVHGPITPIAPITGGQIIVARAYSNLTDPRWDITQTDEPTWEEYYGQTQDVGLFRYTAGGAPTTLEREVQEIEWDEGWQFRMFASNATLSNDDHEIKIEFLNDAGDVIYILRSYKNDSYSSWLEYGPPGEPRRPGTSGYERVDGYFYIRNGILRYHPRHDTNYLYPFWDDRWPVGQVKRARVEVYAISTYSGGGNAGGFVTITQNRRALLEGLPGDTPAQINSGFLMGCWVQSANGDNREQYDVLDTSQPTWEADWKQTHKIAHFEWAHPEDSSYETIYTSIPQREIPVFDNKWIWKFRAQRSAYGSDICEGRIEFLGANGALIYVIIVEHASNYQVRVKHGPDDLSLSTVSGSGQAWLIDGTLTWRPDGFDYVNERASSYVYSFSANFDTTAITKMRFNGKARSTNTNPSMQGLFVKVIGRTA